MLNWLPALLLLLMQGGTGADLGPQANQSAARWVASQADRNSNCRPTTGLTLSQLSVDELAWLAWLFDSPNATTNPDAVWVPTLGPTSDDPDFREPVRFKSQWLESSNQSRDGPTA